MALPNKVYDILKWLCILGLPALSALYSTLAGIWNLPFAKQIPATITATGAFLGTVLGVSSIAYNRKLPPREEETS